jgi:hypothetical protein
MPDEQTQAQPDLIINARPPLYDLFQCCPRAQTYLAYDTKNGCEILRPVGCKTWSCWHCAQLKIKQLSAKTRDAHPNRMLTLTIDPHLYQTPREAFDKTRSQVPELIRRIRKRFGPCEYLRVTELTKKGWPHYHLLLRSNFLPHAWVRDQWQQLTGAVIVDLRQVKKTFAAYNYLVKYLSKLHKIEWTERHVSYSKGFFPEYKKPQPPAHTLERARVIAAHPVTTCLEMYPGWRVRHLKDQTFTLHPPIPEWKE